MTDYPRLQCLKLLKRTATQKMIIDIFSLARHEIEIMEKKIKAFNYNEPKRIFLQQQ